MTVKEAAKKMGVSEETIRLGLQVGAFPFGVAFKPPPSKSTKGKTQKRKGKQFRYIIYPELFKRYVGGEDEKDN